MIELEMVDDLARIDFDKVTALLAESYWSPEIGRTEVLFGARHSTLVIGVYRKDELVGYCRVISDRARFAYLLDVIVDPRYRGQGIGKTMVRYTLGHERLKDVYQWLLRTRDAHGLYSRFGFVTIDQPDRWMIRQIDRPTRTDFHGE
ncbi:MAG: GNAT family N-acetyltransferase [Deltaproteobacteria bacterium]|nr:GNAT family N-acetyltransferase [Deltaproteobacteria bacterium]